MNKKGLTFKIFAFLILNNFLETVMHMSFKKAACSELDFHIHQWQDGLIFISHIIASPFLWLGLLTVIFIFFSWSTILSKIDLSVAIPIASFSYVLVALAALIFLHEYVSPLRWLGIAFILVGVSLVTISSSKTKT